MNEIELRDVLTGNVVRVNPGPVLIAGFTGRDKDSVEQHIRELEELGVPRPDSTPTLYSVRPEKITQSPTISVRGERTSGEAEPVLVCAPEGWFVTVGSDHTDRDIERTDIAESKKACPKPLASEAFPYEYVRDHWASMRLRSWVDDSEGGERPYQDTTVSYITAIEKLIGVVAEKIGGLESGTILFLGTVPVLSGAKAGHRYRLELADDNAGVAVSFAYETIRR